MAKCSEKCVPNVPVCVCLSFLAESTFRDKETVGNPKKACLRL